MTERRNVLIVGKTGGGKSTIANRILVSADDENQPFKVSDEVLSSTECDTVMKSASLPSDNGRTVYHVNVIDTVGLFDTRGIKNVTTLNKMRKFFRENVHEGVHLIIFVFKVGRWTEQEQEVMDVIVKHFKNDIKEVSALVLTGCEQFTEAKRSKTINEFKSRPELKRIPELMQRGIYTVGFPNFSELSEDFIRSYESVVKKDQEKLRSLVFMEATPKLATHFQTADSQESTFWNKVWERCTIL